MPPKKQKPSDKEDPPADNLPSDSDDLEEEDDDDDGGADIAGYSPPENLGDCHWHRRSCGDLVELMEDSEYFDVNPDYQRAVVWPKERMTKLINSLLSGYYVPPLIFNVIEVEVPDGRVKRFKRVSIDGKQRLSSMHAFVKGEIPTTDRKNRRWYFHNDGDVKGRRVLPISMKKKFMNLDILCAEYMHLRRDQEEELFSRVQLGMPLTPAEKLRASSGKWQSFAIELERKYSNVLQVVDNRRGRGFQLVLQVLKQVVIHEDEYEPKYSAGASALKGFCDKPQLLTSDVRKTAIDIFEKYSELVKKHPDTFEDHNYLNAKKFSPIEFVGVAVFINRKKNRNARLLSKDIEHMRAYVREARQDLRSNTWTWKAIIEFIHRIETVRGEPGSEPARITTGTRSRPARNSITSQEEDYRDPIENPDTPAPRAVPLTVNDAWSAAGTSAPADAIQLKREKLAGATNGSESPLFRGGIDYEEEETPAPEHPQVPEVNANRWRAVPSQSSTPQHQQMLVGRSGTKRRNEVPAEDSAARIKRERFGPFSMNE